ncbi:hypothetical protein AYO21_07441 [Fonsecaea monophora]|uniref:Uncharacterized protein n=1 Tax=Fonsecaea monophora TaxID=254056 RepID=A0A177F3Z7_9EURO|nr:hypothetical protein AYO21_07441 [Fonsecaea monophora]OAG38321.1 hypothetical protein AYO21_07441 [Fonsecaea monophora]
MAQDNDPSPQPRAARFLQLPTEIRNVIYSYALLAPGRGYLDVRLTPQDSQHCCPMRLMLCNHQIHREVRELLCNQELRFSAVHDTGHIESNVPCLHGADLAKTRLQFDINPFQYPERIPELWDGLVALCKSLERVPRIPRVDIRCDGTMPRMTPPLHVNEDDLERGPLNCVLLLQPFNLLPVATKAVITVLGGPLNDLWCDNATIQNWAEQYSRQLETRTRRRVKHGDAIPQQGLMLKKREPIVWDIAVYKKLCAAILEDFGDASLDIIDSEAPTWQKTAES